MTNIPAELTYRLFDHRSTLVALALVNRHYNRIVTPILYKKVTLKGCPAIKAFSDALIGGHRKLGQYPRFLHLYHYPDSDYNDPKYFKPSMKQLLMLVPNLKGLRLTLNPLPILYLIEEPQYPFKLHSLEMVPPKNALFVDFLRTQPALEYVGFSSDPGDSDYYCTPGWYGVNSPLEPNILPNLKAIKSDKVNVSFLVPGHPVTNVEVFLYHNDLEFHKQLARTSAALEKLDERIQLHEAPWEAGIVSRCLPSLSFCQASLRDYSLEIAAFSPNLDRRSLLGLLKASDTPSHGLEILRKSLSTFSALERFNLKYNDWYNDLTPEFCESIPELSRFDVWKESCPNLEEITLFRVTLKP